jgi:ankyrin repeat protein
MTTEPLCTPCLGLVQFLLKRCGEESVAWRDADGQTPLHKAQAHGGVHTTEALLAAAAASAHSQDVVSAPDSHGNTPLHLALQAFHDGRWGDVDDVFKPVVVLPPWWGNTSNWLGHKACTNNGLCC